MNTKSAAVALALVLAVAGGAVAFTQSAFAGSDSVSDHNPNCDIGAILAPDSDVVTATAENITQNDAVSEVVSENINATVVDNATDIVGNNTQVTDEVESAVSDLDEEPSDNTTQAIVEVLVNQTVVIDIAQDVVADAIVDIVQSGEPVTEEAINATVTDILADESSVVTTANQTVSDINATELADQVETIVQSNPDVVDQATSDVFAEQTQEQTTVIHLKTSGLPEGNFKLTDENGNAISSFVVKVPGGVAAGDYIVTIQPAEPEVVKEVIQEAQQEGNTTGTVTTDNSTATNTTSPTG